MTDAKLAFIVIGRGMNQDKKSTKSGDMENARKGLCSAVDVK